MHDAADNPSSTLVVCKLITTCLSVAKCQYCHKYINISLTVANLFTYLRRLLNLIFIAVVLCCVTVGGMVEVGTG